MPLPIESFGRWLEGKRAEVRAEPPSRVLADIDRLHRADEFGAYCVGCSKPWPCRTRSLLDRTRDRW